MPGSRAVTTRAMVSKDHWSSLSDEQLLNRTLITDSPETVEGLVSFIPERHEDAHVESSYDFRGQDRKELHCVHGHHAHKAGFVMNVRGQKFLVGWMCGKTIYGENFERYTRAFDQAVIRQAALIRAREINAALDPFTYWLVQVPNCSAFTLYTALRAQWLSSAPWLYDQLRIKCLKHNGHLTVRARLRDEETERQDDIRCQREAELHAKGGSKPQPSRKPIFKEEEKLLCEIPAKSFFEDSESVREKITRVCNEILSQLPHLARLLKEGKDIEDIVTVLRQRLGHLEDIIGQVKAIEELYQPASLAGIAEWANRSDNSKRTYSFRLGAIVMNSGKGEVTLSIPPNYQTPNVSAIASFRQALAGFSLPT